jgi:hypothetical protein
VVAQEREVRAALPDGTLLPTLRESEEARAAAERRAAAAEAELARLRAALERSQEGGHEPGDPSGS